ncbi:MAG: MgtC/SapB family protein [Verrucomicrobiota bacterium]
MEGIAPELRALGQALIAMVLGGIIGWERETAGKWAGFRTHMLVCLAAMFFVKVAQFLVYETQSSSIGDRPLQADPVRIIEAIVTGIAFIGAGTVFRDPHRHVAHGLTTAATLLAVAPIGVSIAIERYVLAVGMTVIIFFVLRVLNRLEKKFIDHRRKRSASDDANED